MSIPTDIETFPVIVKGCKIISRDVNKRKVRLRNEKKCGRDSLPTLSRTAPEHHSKTFPSIDFCYRYTVLPGNNSRVLLSTLRRRPWWSTARDNELDTDLIWEMYRNPKRYMGSANASTLLNHLKNNKCLVSKKGMYKSLKTYCTNKTLNLLDFVPRTFYIASAPNSSHISISSGRTDDIAEFLQHGGSEEGNDIWIVKPASMTNRGMGIKVVCGKEEVMNIVRGRKSPTTVTEAQEVENYESSEEELVDEKINDYENNSILDSKTPSPKGKKCEVRHRDWIVQEYMLNPMLVSGRKFDIRCFVLLTLDLTRSRSGRKLPPSKRDTGGGEHTSNTLRGYLHRDGYVRTSSKAFSLSPARLQDRETHLTNDAVQKKSKRYGQYESGNKLSWREWEEVVSRDYPNAPKDFVSSCILPQIRKITAMSIAAAADQLTARESSNSTSSTITAAATSSTRARAGPCFELLGYDFMVDDTFRVVLIEINSNPCLEFACPLLTQIISDVVEDSFRVAVDKRYPPPEAGFRTKLCEEAVQELSDRETGFDLIYSGSDDFDS